MYSPPWGSGEKVDGFLPGWKMCIRDRAWGGHENYRALEPAHGLEEIWYYQSERNPDFYYLVLRKGGLVMRVEYEGSQDLTQFLPRFAEMLEAL